MKLHTATLEDARNARRARPQIGKRIPQPVDSNGRTPALWADCTAYVVDDDPAATVDDQDLIAAVAASARHPSPSCRRHPRPRSGPVAADLAKAKGDREAGKKISRDAPGCGDEPGKVGGETKQAGDVLPARRRRGQGHACAIWKLSTAASTGCFAVRAAPATTV